MTHLDRASFDRILPSTPGSPDWDDVMRRCRARARSRRRRLLALAAALLTCNAVGREPRLMRIASTLRLDEFAVSASLLEEVRRHPHLEVVAGPGAPAFDATGDLLDLGDPGTGISDSDSVSVTKARV